MKYASIALVALPLLVGCSPQPPANGPFTHYYRNGETMMQGVYKNGNKEGLWTEWHANGQKAGAGEFKSGDYEGPWTMWHSNGQKWTEGEYKGGKPEGLWTAWNDDGSIKHASSGIFKGGLRVGPLPSSD